MGNLSYVGRCLHISILKQKLGYQLNMFINLKKWKDSPDFLPSASLNLETLSALARIQFQPKGRAVSALLALGTALCYVPKSPLTVFLGMDSNFQIMEYQLPSGWVSSN